MPRHCGHSAATGSSWITLSFTHACLSCMPAVMVPVLSCSCTSSKNDYHLSVPRYYNIAASTDDNKQQHLTRCRLCLLDTTPGHNTTQAALNSQPQSSLAGTSQLNQHRVEARDVLRPALQL
eukprot:jgi/Ulvmu1/5981/UM026_0105.1